MKVSYQDIGFQPEIKNSIRTKENVTSLERQGNSTSIANSGLKFSTSSLKHEVKDLSPRVKVDWTKIQEEEYISKESLQEEDILQSGFISSNKGLLPTELNTEQYKRYLNTIDRYTGGVNNLSSTKAFDKYI